MHKNLTDILNSSLLLIEDSFELKDLIDEEINQIGVTKLTQILAILGLCISLIGVIGNFFSIIVLSRKSMKKLSTYSYLLGLSICDEISLIFTVIILLNYAVPNSLLKQSQSLLKNYKILLIYIYPIVSSTQALSVWITLAFTVDRYIYVCHPYYGRVYCSRRKAILVIVSLFFCASIYSIPQFLERTYKNVDILGTEQIFQDLTTFGRNRYFIYIYHLFIYCLFVCLIPITMIVILNCFLIYDILKSNKRHRELNIAYNSSIRSNLNSIQQFNDPKRSISINNYIKPSKSFLSTCLNRKKSSRQEEYFDLDSSITEKCLRVNGNGNSTVTNASFSVFSAAERNFSYDKSLRNDVTIMLIGLIFVFLICQLPSTILRLITFKNLSIYFQPFYYSSLDVSNFLIVTNSTLNCILYVMLGKKFRKEFLNTFFKTCS